VRRVDSRQRNVSDADAGIARSQEAYDVGPLDWARIDASGPRQETTNRALDILAREPVC